MPVISQVSASQNLGEQQDLPGVLGKVLHHMGDGFEHRDVVTLGENPFGQPAGRHE